MHAIIFAAGELLASDLYELCSFDDVELTIAADGGVHHAVDLGLEVDVLIGDLDSIDPALLDLVRRSGQTEIVEYPADKNATDLELALEAAQSRGATQVTVAAAFGGRLDHELATIGLLTSPRWSQISVAASDGRRAMWVVRSQVTLELMAGETLSLVPWSGDVTGVTTTGLQWPLHGETLPLGSTRGVSNVAVASKQTVTIETGVLLAVTDTSVDNDF